jgi:hypothetical protein
MTFENLSHQKKKGYAPGAWWHHPGYPAFSNAGLLFSPLLLFGGKRPGTTVFNLGYLNTLATPSSATPVFQFVWGK